MKLLSVNVSLPKEVPYNGTIITTGIFKEPVQGQVMLRTLNLDGDDQADRVAHGGIHKAVSVDPDFRLSAAIRQKNNLSPLSSRDSQ